MTRAQQRSAPVRAAQIPAPSSRKNGDAHVYGARSRFMTERVLKCCEPIAFQGTQQAEVKMVQAGVEKIDVAAKLKDMW